MVPVSQVPEGVDGAGRLAAVGPGAAGVLEHPGGAGTPGAGERQGPPGSLPGKIPPPRHVMSRQLTSCPVA